MKRPLQVYLDEAELARLDAWSRENKRSKSDAVRLALRALTHPRDGDPLVGLCGLVDGLPRDASERVDAYLQETYVAESAPRYRRRRRGPEPRLRR